MNILQHKYTKLIIIASIVVLSLFILLGLILILSRDKDDKKTNTSTDNQTQNENTSTPQSEVPVKSYPTDVCPDEIIYGKGLPIGVWDGKQYQVTDDEGIKWLDNVCKPKMQDKVSTVSKGWEFVNDKWVYGSGTPPSCPDPVLSISPVDVSKATSILYPGQTRGQYKPHGGFRFDNSGNNTITVKLPITARLVGGAKYTESGDVQYLFDFVSDCGIAIRFDHLLTLSGEFKKIGDKLPLNPPGNSKGTTLEGKEFPAGSIIATGVGIASTHNTGVDFGVYDYRKRNEASADPSYVAKYKSYSASQAFYAVCWLDWLPKADAAIAKSLPGGDAKAGKQSDYCK